MNARHAGETDWSVVDLVIAVAIVLLMCAAVAAYLAVRVLHW